MTDRLIRLMRIITLVQAKPGILARELAERCETTERTIYRDMEALSAMHIPIANMGHGRGYMFISHFAMYPLNWSDEEAQAFIQLADVMEDIRPLLKPAFESAYEKVVASSQKNKTERVEWAEQIRGMFKEGGIVWQNNDGDEPSDSLLLLLQAGISQNSMEGKYQSQGEMEMIRFDPYCLIPREYQFDLLAYCHLSESMRTFQVNRLHDLRIIPRTFRKNDYLIQSYFRTAWISRGSTEETVVKIRFSSLVVDRVMQERFFVRPVLTREPEGTLLFETVVSDAEGFFVWISRYGPEAEILEPEHCRTLMQEHLERWRQVYNSK
ncbi:putative DNA-binding transcriptional regulator YafY [Paenibacillus sp. 4624]|uniref:WYL domain-containing protein n=1 Tax=Paenibacillus amylolyticus TaxID=1451 RepID=A0A5M9WNZ4_PAEAM|nr:WYL domain-containing protein [Paenibacillus amylolyticus]KAA8783291.1 WYL domain-containing protein [Paenibacillus amylolyticus]